MTYSDITVGQYQEIESIMSLDIEDAKKGYLLISTVFNIDVVDCLKLDNVDNYINELSFLSTIYHPSKITLKVKDLKDILTNNPNITYSHYCDCVYSYNNETVKSLRKLVFKLYFKMLFHPSLYKYYSTINNHIKNLKSWQN